MKTILFQGDSITDCYRPRDDDRFLGSGYSEFIKGALSVKYGNEYRFLNRGISGDRIIDIVARLKKDIINLNPDYLSILIGVNDAWHEIDYNNGIETDKFEQLYSIIINQAKKANPNIKIFILEPFVLEYFSTRDTGENPHRWSIFYNAVREKAEAAKRIAEKYDIPFIPLQKKFEEDAKRLGVATLTTDGVHPTPAGHFMIANEWIKNFENNK